MNKTILPLLLAVFTLQAQDYYILEGTSDTSELFSTFNTVLGVLDKFDKGECAGFEVSFSKNGKYFDKSKGTNWWEYFFESLKVGKAEESSTKKLLNYQKRILSLSSQFEMSPARAQFLIDKYIKVKPDIATKVSNFVQHYFKNVTTIGVYYHKSTEPQFQPIIAYDDVYTAIKEKLRNHPKALIFVSTREDKFLKFLDEKFPDMTLTYQLNDEKGKKKAKASDAEYELINALILAKCDYLIRTSSTFSKSVSQFNAAIPIVSLDKNWQEID